MEKINLIEINKWFGDIFKEILHSNCYYYDVNENGQVNEGTKLKQKLANNKTNEIWNIRHRDTDRKINFLEGVIETLPKLGKLAISNKKKEIKLLETINKNIIKKFMVATKNSQQSNGQTGSDIVNTAFSLKEITSLNEEQIKCKQTMSRDQIQKLQTRRGELGGSEFGFSKPGRSYSDQFPKKNDSHTEDQHKKASKDNQDYQITSL